MSGFRRFLLRGNVVELAVAVVIGIAFGNVIQAFVKDLITPLIGLIGGQPDFATLIVTVNNSQFLIGDFLNVLMSFLLVVAVVYFFVVAPYTKLMERFAPAPPPLPTQECPFCLSKIAIRATRCAFCTADLELRTAPPST